MTDVGDPCQSLFHMFFEAGSLSQSWIFLASWTLTRVIGGFPHLYPLKLELQVGNHASWTFVWVLGIWALVLRLCTTFFNCGTISLALDSQSFLTSHIYYCYDYYYITIIISACCWDDTSSNRSKNIQKLNHCLGTGKDCSQIVQTSPCGAKVLEADARQIPDHS